MLIGIGNVEREDDGVGQRVVQRLHQLHPEWPVLLVRQLLPEFVDVVSGASVLIFVDAATDLPAGDVEVSRLGLPTAGVRMGLAGHQFDPVQFLALLHHVAGAGQACRQAWCVRIGVERLGFGQELSSSVARAVDRGIAEVEKLWELHCTVA